MKKCRKCGCEIVNGVNGCTMAGDICFSCKPWNMSRIVPASVPYDDGAADYWEEQILTRQEDY